MNGDSATKGKRDTVRCGLNSCQRYRSLPRCDNWHCRVCADRESAVQGCRKRPWCDDWHCEECRNIREVVHRLDPEDEAIYRAAAKMAEAEETGHYEPSDVVKEASHRTGYLMGSRRAGTAVCREYQPVEVMVPVEAPGIWVSDLPSIRYDLAVGGDVCFDPWEQTQVERRLTSEENEYRQLIARTKLRDLADARHREDNAHWNPYDDGDLPDAKKEDADA